MKLGAELIAETSISVDDTTYFRVGLEINGQEAPGAAGCDRWNVNGMVLPGKRVAASGREADYDYSRTPTGIGFGPMEALAAVQCPVELGRDSRVVITVDNNAVLDPGVFCMDFSLLVHLEGCARPGPVDISLRRPDIKICWPSRGLFKFDITDALDL